MSNSSRDRGSRCQNGAPREGTVHASPEALEDVRLFFGGVLAYPDITTLTSHWFGWLAKRVMGAGWGKQSSSHGFELGAPEGRLRPVRLDNGHNGQTIWLAFYPNGIGVMEDHRRTDLAVLGALAPLEAGEADVKLIRKTLSSTCGSVEDALRKLGDPKLRSEERMLHFALALLRDRRPGFDDLPPARQRELAAQTCERLNEVYGVERGLARLLEYGSGDPGSKLVPAVKDADLDVRLAYLHDVEGRGYVELGEEFGIPQTEKDKEKRENQAVRKSVGRGRRLLDEALDGRWEAEAARRRPG
jgi:hypothetical protein